jgi:uncharacterized protein YpmS
MNIQIPDFSKKTLILFALATVSVVILLSVLLSVSHAHQVEQESQQKYEQQIHQLDNRLAVDSLLRNAMQDIVTHSQEIVYQIAQRDSVREAELLKSRDKINQIIKSYEKIDHAYDGIAPDSVRRLWTERTQTGPPKDQ